jgi:ABC-type transport system involved in cytochrome bd biosynthesis fused ATPase/permease subunit
LIFDDATSSLDAQTVEHFAATINQLKGKVTMLFITHAMPKSLKVDDVVRTGAAPPRGDVIFPAPLQGLIQNRSPFPALVVNLSGLANFGPSRGDSYPAMVKRDG